jgi:cytidylate kinase
MIITIDGPAGAGKSTAAKQLAHRLSEHFGKHFEYLDTGSMYRAAALLGIRKNVNWHVPDQLESLVKSATIDAANGRTFLNGEDITESVRTPEITEMTRFAADHPAIRRMMVELQRKIADRCLADNKGVVTEGRDQGTAVFPDAPYKFFLTATPEERAKRRLGELQQRGIIGHFNDILKTITDRDERDSARTVGPLCEPTDAHRIVSDGMTIAEVVEQIVARIK